MKDPSFYNYVNPVWRWLWNHGWEGPGGPEGPGGQIRAAAERTAFGPQPEPWRAAVPQLFQAIQAKDIAARLDGRRKDEALRSANNVINLLFDDLGCGTPPGKWWPWPGPPPWLWEVISELSLVANTLQPGSLRDGVLDVVTQMAKRASGEVTEAGKQ